MPSCCAKSRSAVITVSVSGARASTSPHGSTIIERPPDASAGRVLADLVGGDTKHWFSIARARSRTSQWSRVVGTVKAAGTVRMRAPSHREHAVELGEADVVADAEPELDAVRRRG